ncbi:efflux RND transporter periplasmic adaptor subunit [Nitrospira defluvii]|uniref:Secretion protein HlyD n=1 Tax=Nitrospira defluvii TaxID=330214 RepID=A0ABM8RT63_9BACT|nr:efflux RND transporter periplasmic adaptor subunit [Nitrospira defluvii]CAE6770502.1 Secretion protein HlyD [Nitrospira defluvii]
MTSLQWKQVPVILVVAGVIGVGLSYWPSFFVTSHKTGDTAAHDGPTAEPHEPVAKVTIMDLRRLVIEETLTVYGSTLPAPDESQTLSVPYECRVQRVLVTAGRVVELGTPLIEIEPSHETKLLLDGAREEQQTAKDQFKLVQQRLTMNLATKQDLLQAAQHLHAATLRTESLERRGAGRSQVLRAATAGVISLVHVRQGQIVPPGGSLVEMIDDQHILVRFGVEEEDRRLLTKGQRVRLFPVHETGGVPMDGDIRVVTQQVNLVTRLVEVLAAPGPQDRLLLNEYVRGEIIIASQEGLVVPRSAVLQQEGHLVLYSVHERRARRHVVQAGLENREQLEVRGNDLHEGQQIVIVGQNQLRDGMAVDVDVPR